MPLCEVVHKGGIKKKGNYLHKFALILLFSYTSDCVTVFAGSRTLVELLGKMKNGE
jgi:hypothetical protein